jgi:hypothetical protein
VLPKATTQSPRSGFLFGAVRNAKIEKGNFSDAALCAASTCEPQIRAPGSVALPLTMFQIPGEENHDRFGSAL